MRAGTIDDVIGELDGIIDWARNHQNRLGYFPALYRTVTAAVKVKWEMSANTRMYGGTYLSRRSSMRQAQVGILVLAWAALIAALFFIGKDTHWGLTLWRIGTATLLLDIVLIMLWPTSPEGARAPSAP